MPFIGQEPLTGAYHVLDAITTSATATYNLQLNSGAFSPATANQLLVSLNGVIQKPGSSFTISGSQITFSSALTSSDSIDFIIALGDVLSVGTPTDGSVATAKIAPNAVTDAKIASGAVTAAKLPSTLDLSSKTLTIPTTSVKPMFVTAYPSGLLTLTNDAFTLLQLNTQGLNNGLTWDTTNYRCTFNATTAGKYLIHISVSYYNSNNNFSECLLQIRRNGSTINEPLFLASGTGGGIRIAELRHFTGYATTTESFSSGDYLDFTVLMQSSGSSQVQSRQYGTQATIIRIND